MSILYLLRHTESQANADPLLYGHVPNHDIKLTKQGEEDAVKIGQTIADDASDLPPTIFCSLYQRTRQTAEIISKQHFKGKKVTEHPMLGEREFGEQEGCPHINDYTERPMERHMYEKQGYFAYRPIRGESCNDVYMRAAVFMLHHDSLRFYPFTVIVSHESFCLMMHAYLTHTMPSTKKDWNNGEIRKYKMGHALSSKFQYVGTLQ